MRNYWSAAPAVGCMLLAVVMMWFQWDVPSILSQSLFGKLFGVPENSLESHNLLKPKISAFYDSTSKLWIDTWGEDMHHGYYNITAEKSENLYYHRDAQRLMIQRALEFAYNGSIPNLEGKHMLDVGCGVGGSSRYIAANYGISATGISLSSYQVERARELTLSSKLHDDIYFQVADALYMPFPDNYFDLTWSMESAEHITNKAKLLEEMQRVTKPGGTIVMVTWCQRELQTHEEKLTDWEQTILTDIKQAFYLGTWAPLSTYEQIAKNLGLQDIRSEDWTSHVLPFWPAVIQSALNPKTLLRVLFSGITVWRSILASIWMWKGEKLGVIKIIILAAQKLNS